jgi:glycosyltransferase involved in cell wall biosynthesis
MSGAVQMRDLVREFADQGHEPTVIVPDASQPESWKIERNGRITVLRVRTPRTKDIDYIRRTINEMRLPWVLLRAVRASGVGSQRWDGVVWYSPTIFLGPIVRALRRQSGCRSYLILRDIFPEWVVDMGLMRRGLAYWFFKWIERGQYAVADTIGVQTPANLPYLKQWSRRPNRRLEVLQNWLRPAASTGCRIDVSRTRLAGRRILVYTGNMGVAQGMDVFMELAERMKNDPRVGFLFVGRGSDAARFAVLAESRRLDNVVFHDEIEPEEIPGLLRQCHVGIVALDPRHKSHNIPGKFLTYMQAGLPVLARINPGNDLEHLIRSEGVGQVCTTGGASALQELVERLISDPDELAAARDRGRRLGDRLFSPQAAVRQIVSALEPARSASHAAPSVLLLNQVFWPDVAATAQYGHDLGRFLVANGYRVTAVASRSLYGARGADLPRRDWVDGVEIVRCGKSRFGKQRFALRALDFLIFQFAAMFRTLTLPRHDVIICLTTPPLILWIGLLLRRLRGTRVISWCMDLYPEVPVAAGLIRAGSVTHRLFRAIDRWSLRRADRIVVLGRCMRDLVIRKGVSPNVLAQIDMWADPIEIQAAPELGDALRARWGLSGKFVLQYSGNFGIGHDSRTMSDAILAMKDDESIHWLIVGGGAKYSEMETFVTRRAISNALLRPYQPRNELGALLNVGDVHLVSIAKGFQGLLVPSKFYGIMATGRPTILIGPSTSEVARVIHEERCGIVVEPGDASGLVEAIRALRDDAKLREQMGGRARSAAERRFGMQSACKQWDELLRSVVGNEGMNLRADPLLPGRQSLG